MSRPHSTVDDLLIDRYVAGACTPDERRLVEQWAASDPTRRQRLAHARVMVEQVDRSFKHYDLRPNWSLWLAREGQEGQRFVVPGMPAAHKWMALAACLVVALRVGLLTVTRSHAVGERFVAGRQYTTAVAEHRMVWLADGTRVTLAPASRLVIARGYGQHSREVKLEGEAYFTVVHDEAHPFSIRTSQAVARDIGTAFDLKAYAEDAGARVAVSEGEVALIRVGCASGDGSSSCAANVRQGEVAFVDHAGVSVERVSDIGRYAAWMQGRLVFDKTPLRDVVRELERDFGLEITIEDSAASRQHVSGNFNNVPVDQVLDEITQTIGAQFEHHGRSVVIKRASTSTPRDGKAPDPLATALRSN